MPSCTAATRGFCSGCVLRADAAAIAAPALPVPGAAVATSRLPCRALLTRARCRFTCAYRQVNELETTIDTMGARETELEEELAKHSSMMDQVMNFRDKESAHDIHELQHENADLTAQLERWKERAQSLQQERWTFVQKFRAAKAEGDSRTQTANRPNKAAGSASDEEDEDERGSEPSDGGGLGEDDEDW